MIDGPNNSHFSQLAVFICGLGILLAPWSPASVESRISHTLECAKQAIEVFRLSKEVAWWKWLAQLLICFITFVLSVAGALVWLSAGFCRAFFLRRRAPQEVGPAVNRAPNTAERQHLLALRDRQHGMLPGH